MHSINCELWVDWLASSRRAWNVASSLGCLIEATNITNLCPSISVGASKTTNGQSLFLRLVVLNERDEMVEIDFQFWNTERHPVSLEWNELEVSSLAIDDHVIWALSFLG